MSCVMSSTDICFTNKNLFIEKVPDSDACTGETLEKEYYHSFHQKTDEEEMLPKLIMRPP